MAERQASAITSRDIARAAGVSDGVLYNYFTDKHELLVTALLRRFDRLIETFNVDAAPVGASNVNDALQVHIQRLFDLNVQVLPMIANLVSEPALLHRFMAEIHRPSLGGDVFRRSTVEFLAGEQRLGRLGAFDAEAAGDLIAGAVLMQSLLQLIGGQASDVSRERLAGIAATLVRALDPRD
jgi:AcrR family transcriptional regulator